MRHGRCFDATKHFGQRRLGMNRGGSIFIPGAGLEWKGLLGYVQRYFRWGAFVAVIPR